ncbi:MAG: proton-conducting transporter membrane subunit [Gemmataceae bacterium]
MEMLGALVVFGVAASLAGLLGRWPHAATMVGAGGLVLACGLAVVSPLRTLLTGESLALRLSWDSAHGPFSIGVDPLSAFFLLPVLGLSALAAIYGAEYLLAYRDHKPLGAPWFFLNLFVGGMVAVLVARSAILFLMAWEVMSITAYCLVTFEHENAEVRQAGWTYLIATHIGVAFLIFLFVLLGQQAGSLEFERLPLPGAAWGGLLFVLTVIGFGAKAGLVPFHVWLPEAHPAAPSHVSALMSGVMIKMGIYGMLRVFTFLGPPVWWWGASLAGLGLVTAFVGIALALGQRDIKRMLAYSSIENVGLIALALGVSLWGQTRGLPVVAALGLSAALLHVWNHALMKSLMFFAAGSVLHATGTRDVEKLGGLMPVLPRTARALLIGAVALSALPPLNGFVSKWLIYLSLMKTGSTSAGPGSLLAFFAIGGLALVGGLTAIVFARLTGIALLGSPRTEATRTAHESSGWLLVPMCILVCGCLLMALWPDQALNLFAPVVEQKLGPSVGPLAAEAAPVKTIGILNGVILALVALGVLLLSAWSQFERGPREATWGCGYVLPTVRMQYTGRSFAEMMAEQLLPRFLQPLTRRSAPRELFPAKSEFGADCPDPVRTHVYQPFFDRWGERFAGLRFLQQGKMHVYLMYIALMVVAVLGWVSLRFWWTTT